MILFEFFTFLLPPMAATAFFWLTSSNEISLFQGLSAFILLCVPWCSYLQWKRRGDEEVPIFSLVSFMYWVYFGLPLFWGDRYALNWQMAVRTVSDQAVTDSMAMVLLGLVSLWLGMKSHIGNRWGPKNLADISDSPTRSWYLRFILIFGGVLGLYERLPYLFGEGGRQIIIVLQSTIPLVAFAILFRQYLRREALGIDKILIVGFVFARFMIGMASGWVGGMVFIIIICVFIYIGERKRIPLSAIVLGVVLTILFQVTKGEFRNVYWYGQIEAGKIERVLFWINQTLAKWEATFIEGESEELISLAYRSLSRVSLLTQTANVVELTPSTVPYQYGRLYSYMTVTLIPRFLWSDKPSVNEANRFYQLAYGVTREKDLDRTSIGMGILAEAYINFGWLGVGIIMYLLGIFFDFFQGTFLTKTSGLLFNSVGVVLLTRFIVLESQLVVYLGGILQAAFLIFVVFSPIIRLRKLGRQQNSRAFGF